MSPASLGYGIWNRIVREHKLSTGEQEGESVPDVLSWAIAGDHLPVDSADQVKELATDFGAFQRQRLRIQAANTIEEIQAYRQAVAVDGDDAVNLDDAIQLMERVIRYVERR